MRAYFPTSVRRWPLARVLPGVLGGLVLVPALAGTARAQPAPQPALRFDEVALVPTFEDDGVWYFGQLEALGDGHDFLNFPADGVPGPRKVQNPACGNRAVEQEWGGMPVPASLATPELPALEHVIYAEAKAKQQVTVARIIAIQTSARTVEALVDLSARAVVEGRWEEEDGSDVTGTLTFDLVADVANPNGQDYLVSLTWTDLEGRAEGTGTHRVQAGFKGSTCRADYPADPDVGGVDGRAWFGSWLGDKLFIFDSEQDGDLSVPVGTGRTFRVAGERDGEFVLRVAADVGAQASELNREYGDPDSGTASLRGKFQLELAPAP